MLLMGKSTTFLWPCSIPMYTYVNLPEGNKENTVNGYNGDILYNPSLE